MYRNPLVQEETARRSSSLTSDSLLPKSHKIWSVICHDTVDACDSTAGGELALCYEIAVFDCFSRHCHILAAVPASQEHAYRFME